MRTLLSAADDYISRMTWKDMGLVKLCLCSVGVLLGLSVGKRARKWAALGAMVVFLFTYIPLILDFLPHLGRALKED